MPSSLDQMMESASEALARTDYLACEGLCLKALAEARAARDWAYYARILLPLQESRRHRRMIAAEGVLRLGTTSLAVEPDSWLEQLLVGCVVLTQPHQAAQARAVVARAAAERRFVEVLLADNAASAAHWTLRAFDGPAITCAIPRPPEEWLDRWLVPTRPAGKQAPTSAPAAWFIAATEALGDAALAQVSPAEVGEHQIEALEKCLIVVTDHELIHQRLGAAARAMLSRCPS